MRHRRPDPGSLRTAKPDGEDIQDHVKDIQGHGEDVQIHHARQTGAGAKSIGRERRQKSRSTADKIQIHNPENLGTGSAGRSDIEIFGKLRDVCYPFCCVTQRDPNPVGRDGAMAKLEKLSKL